VGVFAVPSAWAAELGEWTITMLSGDELKGVVVDSVNSDWIFIDAGDRAQAIPLDSVGAIEHRPGVSLSARSYAIGLGAAIFGVAIFLNNTPALSENTVWSGAIYGLEFGGTMMLGAVTGIGVGYLFDYAESHEETVDLRREPRARKREIVGELLSRYE
jgi:hypothetical protein